MSELLFLVEPIVIMLSHSYVDILMILALSWIIAFFWYQYKKRGSHTPLIPKKKADPYSLIQKAKLILLEDDVSSLSYTGRELEKKLHTYLSALVEKAEKEIYQTGTLSKGMEESLRKSIFEIKNIS